MTHAEQILQAVSVLLYQHGKHTFTRHEIRLRLGIGAQRWKRGYASIFESMRVDSPPGMPSVGNKYQNIFQREQRGQYSLTPYGSRLVDHFERD